MVDPTRITDYQLSTTKLEEMILFWVCAAGKNAKSAAAGLDKLLYYIKQQQRRKPFHDIRQIPDKSLPHIMKDCGIGCYNQKSRTFRELAHSGLNLRTCSVDDLEQIKGIGMKTSRCFVMHSRANAECAGLDTHILKFLRSKGIDAPKQTPTRKRYLQLEQEFLKLVRKSSLTVAEFDLKVWNEYSRSKAAK